MAGWVAWLDLLGVAVFAATGALVASRKQMDLVGFGLMASATGIGGGTLRDVLLERPVFWIADGRYLAVCLGIAVLIYLTAHIVQRRFVVLLWADAIGISAYAVMGAELGLRAGAAPPVAVVLGVMTATFGGLIRDVLCQETPLILRREIYATAVAAGAGAYVITLSLGAEKPLAAILGFAIGFAVRAGGIGFGWSLPTYRPRPGRDYPVE
ncbi:trimeric intracellular cation channel family protein [Thalassobaculum sp.]|uniref:trimeric intracellular cation channel family protein n=1 Tax=Thalassobaculum sp. TaxID=2022740 RepID=UPI0032EDFAA1